MSPITKDMSSQDTDLRLRLHLAQIDRLADRIEAIEKRVMPATKRDVERVVKRAVVKLLQRSPGEA